MMANVKTNALAVWQCGPVRQTEERPVCRHFTDIIGKCIHDLTAAVNCAGLPLAPTLVALNS